MCPFPVRLQDYRASPQRPRNRKLCLKSRRQLSILLMTKLTGRVNFVATIWKHATLWVFTGQFSMHKIKILPYWSELDDMGLTPGKSTYKIKNFVLNTPFIWTYINSQTLHLLVHSSR